MILRILRLPLQRPQHTSRLLFHSATHRSALHFFYPLQVQPLQTSSLNFHTSPIAHSSTFTNILADDNPPPVQVSSIMPEGIQLADGLVIPSACIFLEGKVFLWDVPENLWAGWRKDHFEVFEVVVPKPEILLLGTGKKISQPPPFLRTYLNRLGIQLDVMDTRNACSTYNLLAEEGRRVAAGLLPYSYRAWKKSETPRR